MVTQMIKNLSAMQETQVRSLSLENPGKISWRREWLPTPVLLPEKPMYRGAWQATVYGVAKSRTHD